MILLWLNFAIFSLDLKEIASKYENLNFDYIPLNCLLPQTIQVILEEVSNGIHGLAYECTQICCELELPDIMGTFANKNRIKSSIFLKMNEKALEDMRNSNKVSDRLTDNPQDNTYMHCLSLPESFWV